MLSRREGSWRQLHELLNDVKAIGCGTELSVPARAPHPHSGCRAAVTRVEPEDLASFEGEGGGEAPEPARPHPEEPSVQ